MFREAVQIIHKMWTEDYPRFEGKHYTIDGPINEPKGVRKPHPSLWIGGGGEKVTLKLVAQYGDASNFGDGDPEIIRQKCDVLKRHCEALGPRLRRDHQVDRDQLLLSTRETDREQTTARSVSCGHVGGRVPRNYWVGTSEEIAELLRPAIDAGIDYVILYMPRIAYDHGRCSNSPGRSFRSLPSSSFSPR